MSLEYEGKPVDWVVLDCDDTLFELPDYFWPKVRRDLAQAIVDNGKVDYKTSVEVLRLFESKNDEVEDWSYAYELVGGTTEDFDQIAQKADKSSHIQPDPELKRVVRKLANHAEVLFFTGSHHKQIADALEVLFGEEWVSWTHGLIGSDDLPKNIQKPRIEAYREVLRLYAIEPERAVMADDKAKELEQAAAVGFLGTILVGEDKGFNNNEGVFNKHKQIKRAHELLSVFQIKE